MTNLRNHTQIKHWAFLINLTNFRILWIAIAGLVGVFVNQICNVKIVQLITSNRRIKHSVLIISTNAIKTL